LIPLGEDFNDSLVNTNKIKAPVPILLGLALLVSTTTGCPKHSVRPLLDKLPKAHALPEAVCIDHLDFQIPSTDDYLINPDVPLDSWLN
jgi:hypothetical protein